jgi:TRAP-type C4-dicarboxylate transport system substrate-binding protein
MTRALPRPGSRRHRLPGAFARASAARAAVAARLALPARTLALLGASLALVGATLAAPVHAQTTLTVSIWSPPTSFVPPTIAGWGKEVEAATQGRVKLNILPKPVTNLPGHYDAARNGLVDVTYVVLGATPGRFVLPRIIELPFVGKSAETNSVAFQQVYAKHLASMNEFAGVKLLTVFTAGPNLIYMRDRPAHSLADIQGAKFRVAAGTLGDIGKALGVTPTVKPITELFELLSGGIVDGAFTTLDAADAFRLDRAVKYATVFPEGLTSTAFAMIMNQGAWSKLSKADQDAIDKLSGEHLARIWGRAFDNADRKGMAYLQAGKVAVTTASPAFVAEVRKRTSEIDAGWIAEARAKGLKDPDKVLAELRRLAAAN